MAEHRTNADEGCIYRRALELGDSELKRRFAIMTVDEAMGKYVSNVLTAVYVVHG